MSRYKHVTTGWKRQFVQYKLCANCIHHRKVQHAAVLELRCDKILAHRKDMNDKDSVIDFAVFNVQVQ